MARLTTEQKDALVHRTVDVLLHLRAQYLANGANALKHWNQIGDRMREASATSRTVEEWTTRMMRTLQIGQQSKALSTSVVALRDEVTAQKRERDWLRMCAAEQAYIVAVAQMEAEDRKTQRETSR